ncbi:unnamed protein product [Bursaphelenchus xylophilus]|uniref:(pine wood nematode) hypothetical protein n=1 Tax=Bursaphelenchus xylophilus TaxID=6326 RepID=A0A1I7SRA6_BURXY|nr:unnamed protein product [Bursaphelenchus xylophilus]CAG9111052.1 unnamed protein product [Bursaphelenchus xylophilus]
MKLCFWILLTLTSQYLVDSAITLLVKDYGVETLATLSFGSNAEEHSLEVLLNSPEIALIDQQCTNTYGVCKEHCKNDVFCRLYCSPMCCIPPEVRKKRCEEDEVHREGFSHNTSTLKILREYWKSPYDLAVGVWVEDQVRLKESDTDIGRTKFALKVVSALYRDELIASIYGELGFGRHPEKRNLLLTMLDRGIIKQPVLSMVYRRNADAKYIFGEFNEEFCHSQRHAVDAVGSHEWMFDANAAEFFDYKSSGRPFRIILRSTGFVHMPRNFVSSLEALNFAPIYKPLAIMALLHLVVFAMPTTWSGLWAGGVLCGLGL